MAIEDENLKKSGKLLNDQVQGVEVLKSAFTSLSAIISSAIEDAIEKAEGLNDVSEKIAKTNERELVGSVKKIGTQLENNVDIQFKILQGEDQSKKISEQRVKIQSRIAITQAGILQNEELSGDIKSEMLSNLYAQEDIADDLLDNLEAQNIANLGNKNLLELVGDNMTANNVILAKMLKGFTEGIFNINKNVTSLQKEFGFTAAEAVKLDVSFRSIASNIKGNVVLSKDLHKTFSDINGQLGLASTAFRKDILGQASDLQKRLELSGEATANIAFQAQKTGKSVDDITKSSIKNVLSAEKEGGIRVAMASAFKEAAETTGIIRANLGFNVESITGAIAKARQFGMTLQGLADISGNLLNFQSSIEAELQAELFTGKQLNLEKARLFALTGNYEGLTEEIKKNVGSELEFAKMNVLQKEKLATALGMSVDAMSDLVFNQAYLATLSDKERTATEEEIFQSMRKRDLQQQFNDLIDKAQESILNLAAGPLGTMMNMMTSILDSAFGLASIMTLIGAVSLASLVKQVFLLGKFMGSAAKRAAFMKVVTGGLKGVAMVGLAGLITAGIMSQVLKPSDEKMETIGDGISDGGTLVKKPKGSLNVMLNEDDNFIAFSNKIQSSNSQESLKQKQERREEEKIRLLTIIAAGNPLGLIASAAFTDKKTRLN